MDCESTLDGSTPSLSPCHSSIKVVHSAVNREGIGSIPMGGVCPPSITWIVCLASNEGGWSSNLQEGTWRYSVMDSTIAFEAIS